MNPPYGREIGKWVAQAFESARQGAVVVCLLPARTDTAWWHSYVMQAYEIRFVRGAPSLRRCRERRSLPFGGGGGGGVPPLALVGAHESRGVNGRGLAKHGYRGRERMAPANATQVGDE